MNSEENKKWTILELLETSANYLKEKDFEDSRLSVELLLAETLKLSRIGLYSNFDREITRNELIYFKNKFKLLISNEPLQYILGKTSFYGLEIICDKRALIPRPETESIVEKCIEFVKTHFPVNQKLAILDICTGTACIAIALAKNLENVEVTAIDNDINTLNLAKENIIKHNLQTRIYLEQIDLENNLPAKLNKQFDLVICNPPYISNDEYLNLPIHIKNNEPRQALTDEGDGLKFYKLLSNLDNQVLKNNSRIFLEHAYNQSEKVNEIFLNKEFLQESLIYDLSKNIRGAVFKFTVT